MTYHPCSAKTSRKSGALTYPEPLGPPRPVARDLYFFFTFNYITMYSAINIRVIASAKESLGLYELKQHKPLFHEEYLQILSKETG